MDDFIWSTMSAKERSNYLKITKRRREEADKMFNVGKTPMQPEYPCEETTSGFGGSDVNVGDTMAYNRSKEFTTIARETVVGYFNTNVRYRKDRLIFVEDTSIVWFAKTLGNWKALVTTNQINGQYYEVTYDGNRNKIYLDVYCKAENVEITP